MIISEKKVFMNDEFDEFLDSLSTEHDVEIACKTFDWLKERYPDIIRRHYGIIQRLSELQQEMVEALAGRLVHQDISEE